MRWYCTLECLCGAGSSLFQKVSREDLKTCPGRLQNLFIEILFNLTDMTKDVL